MKAARKWSAMFLLILSFVFLFGMRTTVEAATYRGTCGAGVNWTLDTNTGVLNITGSGEMKDYGTANYMKSPWYDYNDYIKTVIVNTGVKRIGEWAFYLCDDLYSVSMSDTVTSIGANAFNHCSALKEVQLSENLLTIDSGAFADCAVLDTIQLPDKLTDIGGSAFSGCSSLSQITIPASVRTVGREGFSWSGLKSVRINSADIILGEMVFRACKTLKSVTFVEGIQEIPWSAFTYCYELTAINFPKSLRKIGESAFVACTKLKGVVLPDGLETIDSQAFYDTAIEHIIIPETVTSIGEGVFRECENLQKVAVLNADMQFDEYDTYGALGVSGVVTVYCYPDSTAYNHVVEHDYAFEYITDNNLWEDTQEYPNPFNDIAEKEYYYHPVTWAVSKGITTGLTETTFGPDISCTRGQIVTFLWRAMGQPLASSESCSFKDVPSDQYYYDAVLWAVEKGITTGLTKTSFAPDTPCTRGQIVTFLHRTMNTPKPVGSSHSFTDISSKEFYYDAILWAVEKNITTGLTKTTFGPNQPCTRGQIVTFLYRAFA